MFHPNGSTAPGRHRAARRWGLSSAIGTAAAALALVLSMSTVAHADTLFSDNFEDGNSTGWSKSGGDWSIVADGSQVFAQTKVDSELARQFAGDTSWTAYTLSARVKVTAWGASGPYAGIVARSTGATTFYRLALLNTGRVELQAVNSGTVTVIGGASRTVSTGTWYTLRIDVSGNTITGYVDGTQIASGSSTLAAAGRIGVQTFHTTAEFDDVAVSSVGTTPSPSASASKPASPSASPTKSTAPSPSTSTSPPPPSTGIIGWATQNGGTTGGNGGSTTTVTSLSALTTAVTGDSAKIVQINGNFTCSADVRVGSNTTVIGVGASSGLTGCGLNMKSVHNVIIRNLKISKVVAGNGNGDAIHIETSTNIWIDHNDLGSDTTHGTDYYDGLLDITHAGDFITVSWNKLHDHIKCSLVGHSDSNASEDTGHLRVTYHHNYFSTCAERGPRVRFGNPVHVFNNYYYMDPSYTDYHYSIATTCGAGVLVEGNYFENQTDPTHLSEGSSPGGNLVARNNVLVNSGAILSTGSGVNAIPYSYTVDDPNGVKASVTAGAGTGHI
ncbi:pectate lyase family protein [Hamadaea tsunoensis]|uniref:pectate lyase family protein n=1 Tax=Hamadaea tsunoensis TaxID=53368 RepID=UPI0004096460|nr:family 16 glycoside hydrolase [Hamadaea tsunoensis]